MNMSGRFPLIAAVLILAGCRNVWYHNEWYEGRYDKDREECRALETIPGVPGMSEGGKAHRSGVASGTRRR